MFMGRYDHTLDPKGRVIVPAKFREELGEHFILTMGLDGCLVAYPEEKFQRFAESLEQLPSTEEARSLVRRFLENVDDVTIDKQGRMLIQPKLRAVAGLEKDVVLIGMLSKIEVWSKERLEQSKENTKDKSMEEIMEHLKEYGISY